MNTLILNRDSFQMPDDGWYQIAPIGEFAHAQAGLVQVVDREACEAMVNRFREEAKGTNFAGLLVDFDHFSLDGEKRSEAAGWVVGLENRDGGLFAQIRWSDVGEEAVKGGRYRFLSPVWARGDCVDLGNGRVRPVRLLNAAVTNDPNLKGMQPLSNSASAATAKPDQRYKWVLGNSPEGHCPSCAALAGQVRTMAEWQSSGAGPGSGGLYCQGKCHCSLEPTDEAATGAIDDVPVRKGGWNLDNRLPNDGEGVSRLQEFLTNKWSDAARAASLAVRQQKAAARQAQGGGNQPQKRGDINSMSRGAIEDKTGKIRDKLARGKGLTAGEKKFLNQLGDKGYAGEGDGDPIFQYQERESMREQQVHDVTGMDAKAAKSKANSIKRKQARGKPVTDAEREFLGTYGDLMGNRADEALYGEEVGREEEAADIVLLANTGWTDEARVAALAVRRAKATTRAGLVMPGPKLPLGDDGIAYAGGTPYFDEATGQYAYPVSPALPPQYAAPVSPPGVRPGVPGSGPIVKPRPPGVPPLPGPGKPPGMPPRKPPTRPVPPSKPPKPPKKVPQPKRVMDSIPMQVVRR